MSKMSKQELLKMREYTKKYRAKTLNKTKKFFTVRVSRDEGKEIKEFIKQYGIPIKKIIDEGTEIMWGDINGKN